ncbi:MAG TPA: zinc-binding dehydrogenase [Pseudomonadales bacterium]|nr:zinc-binding dehydrogenase [Pseudomonadales bacterium]HND14136.1 zinc-binding dehydrogenase [Pseudomonadales bacterium]
MIGIVGGLGSIDYLHLLPVIDREFPFAQATQAVQHFAARGHIGKVVITHD